MLIAFAAVCLSLVFCADSVCKWWGGGHGWGEKGRQRGLGCNYCQLSAHIQHSHSTTDVDGAKLLHQPTRAKWNLSFAPHLCLSPLCYNPLVHAPGRCTRLRLWVIVPHEFVCSLPPFAAKRFAYPVPKRVAFVQVTHLQGTI